jgi:hypothetical protein
MMRYLYSGLTAGHPLLSWRSGPPRQTRAADATSLGSLGDPTLVLPRAGAPEPINCAAIGDLGCQPGTGMSGIVDTISGLPTVVKIGGAIALAYLLFKKR